MNIKRYFATDMRQAIKMVRDEQGPDAVILSNQRVAGGVEIVSALDYNEEAFNAATGLRDKEQQIEWSQDPALISMRNELNLLRGVIEGRLNGIGWERMKGKDPHRARVLERLFHMGLNPLLCRKIVEQIPCAENMKRSWSGVLKLLTANLTVTNDDILHNGGIVAIIGPTGAGKTSSVAKLAAHYTMRHGAGRVALITTDSYRVGAHQQLRTYGRILGAPVHVVKDGDDLHATLKLLQDNKSLVLIDTAGMGQQDSYLIQQFTVLRQAGMAIRSYIVLAASSQRSTLEKVVRSLSEMNLAGAILTKMDETVLPGEVISVVIQNRLPVAYVSDGQRVPEDFHQGCSNNLINICIGGMRQLQERPVEERLAMEFGQMVG